jgi:uncharacterized protein
MMQPAQAPGFVPGQHVIEAYGAGGFRFAGLSHRGSILALPDGVYAWDITSVEAVDPAFLAGKLAEAAQPVDILIIGCGARMLPPYAPQVLALKALGVNADWLDTATAARTYSFLLDEGRRVAAALIAIS